MYFFGKNDKRQNEPSVAVCVDQALPELLDPLLIEDKTEVPA